jgi:hypothetical protein
MKTENRKASYRRVVTAVVQGKSVIQSDDLLQDYNFETFQATSIVSSGRIHPFPISVSNKRWIATLSRSFLGREGQAFISLPFHPVPFSKIRRFDGKAAYEEARFATKASCQQESR